MIIFNVALEYTPIWVESLYSHVYVCVCVYVGRARPLRARGALSCDVVK